MNLNLTMLNIALGKKEVGGLLYELLINPLGNVFSSHAMIKQKYFTIIQFLLKTGQYSFTISYLYNISFKMTRPPLAVYLLLNYLN